MREVSEQATTWTSLIQLSAEHGQKCESEGAGRQGLEPPGTAVLLVAFKNQTRCAQRRHEAIAGHRDETENPRQAPTKSGSERNECDNEVKASTAGDSSRGVAKAGRCQRGADVGEEESERAQKNARERPADDKDGP